MRSSRSVANTLAMGDRIRAWAAEAYLDEILALRLGDQRLQLWCSECVHKTGLRYDEEQDLCACQHGQLVGLEVRARQ